MVKLFRSILMLAIVFGGLAQSRAQSTGALGNISGRVTQHGKPLGNIQVKATGQLTVRPDTPGYETRSDTQGYYQIRSVPAGHYLVAASELGLVPGRNDQVSGSPRQVSVSDGETVSDVNFELITGGVISGAVTESAGKPLAQQSVILTSVSEQPNPTLLVTNVSLMPFTSGYFKTDEQGLYRVNGIPPGSYLISIGSPFIAFAAFHGRPAYRQTFFPNASDRAHARPVEITEGATLSNIDFNLGQPVATFSLKGRVLMAANGSRAPSVAFDLKIEESGERGTIPKAGTSNANGEFQLDNLPAGHYSLEVSEERRGEKGEFFGASSWFDIRDSDVSDIELRVMRTLGIVGRVSVENTNDPTVLAKVSQLDLTIEVFPDDRGPIIFKPARANPDLTFATYGLRPGRLRAYVNSPNQIATLGLRFLRLESDGKPVREVEIGDNKPVTDLRVVLVYGSGSLRGSVRLENGSLPVGARVAVNVKDEKGFYAGGWVDTKGNFLLKSIPAGSYTLNVTAEEPGKRTLGPAAQQTISVSNDKITTTTISLDLSSLKNP